MLAHWQWGPSCVVRGQGVKKLPRPLQSHRACALPTLDGLQCVASADKFDFRHGGTDWGVPLWRTYQKSSWASQSLPTASPSLPNLQVVMLGQLVYPRPMPHIIHLHHRSDQDQELSGQIYVMSSMQDVDFLVPQCPSRT